MIINVKYNNIKNREIHKKLKNNKLKKIIILLKHKYQL